MITAHIFHRLLSIQIYLDLYIPVSFTPTPSMWSSGAALVIRSYCTCLIWCTVALSQGLSLEIFDTQHYAESNRAFRTKHFNWSGLYIYIYIIIFLFAFNIKFNDLVNLKMQRFFCNSGVWLAAFGLFGVQKKKQFWINSFFV